MRIVVALVPLLLAGCGAPEGGLDGSGEPLVDAGADDAPIGAASLSFVVVGCNRVEKDDVGVSPSTANLAQLARTFEDVAALDPAPTFLFFAGDMVYGYEDAPTLERELQAWIALYEASSLPARGVRLVAVPGNHEVQHKNGSSKLAYVEAEAAWVRVMGRYIAGENGPGPAGPDHLQTDQSRLTYSFDHGGIHFVVLDTDPVGADGQVPAAWVAADVTAARATGARHIFAIGHKPAYPSPLSSEGGFSVTSVRDAFWSALEASHTEAMIAAHNHLWYATRPGKTWQIVAGNGGSLLGTDVTGADAYYGFTLVRVEASGSVTATSYGRDVPASGYTSAAPAAQYPTTVRRTIDVTWQ